MARLAGRCREPWREGEQVREQVAVRYPEREGVGGYSVGVASYSHARRINRAARDTQRLFVVMAPFAG